VVLCPSVRPFVFRQHRSSSQMRSIATYGVAWSVCVSVCLLVTLVSPAKTAEPIDDSGGRKEPCIRWGQEHPRKGTILRTVRLIEKHWECLLRCTQQKG